MTVLDIWFCTEISAGTIVIYEGNKIIVEETKFLSYDEFYEILKQYSARKLNLSEMSLLLFNFNSNLIILDILPEDEQ